VDDFYKGNLAARVNAALGIGPEANQDLIAFWYQSAHAVAWRILVPLAWIAWVLRDSPREYGYRLPERGHRAIYLYLYLLMLPVLAAVSFLPSFRAMYPIYGVAWGSPEILVPYVLAYGLRFAAVEAFFRGFLLFALFRRFGYHAVAIMVVPYCMIHFGKPFAETLGSIGAGLLLGYLALRGRSWVPGALLHWGIALSMDLLGLAQRHLNS
jgi:membrane protease YdiL (CAAX protease family)